MKSALLILSFGLLTASSGVAQPPILDLNQLIDHSCGAIGESRATEVCTQTGALFLKQNPLQKAYSSADAEFAIKKLGQEIHRKSLLFQICTSISKGLPSWARSRTRCFQGSRHFSKPGSETDPIVASCWPSGLKGILFGQGPMGSEDLTACYEKSLTDEIDRNRDELQQRLRVEKAAISDRKVSKQPDTDVRSAGDRDQKGASKKADW